MAGQVALTLLLLFGCGLLLRSLTAALRVPLGYNASGVLTVSVSPPESRYPDAPSLRRLYDEILARVRAIPGVTAAGMTNVLPHVTTARTGGASRPDRPAAETVFAGYRIVDPGYFVTLDIPLQRGERDLLQRLPPDRALVDETLARQLWPDESPIGGSVGSSWGRRTLPVGGVVGAVREWDQTQPIGVVYVDYHAETSYELMTEVHVVVRADADAASVAAAVRREVSDLDPLVPVAAAPLADQVGRAFGPRRLVLSVAAGFGGVALLLAAVGVHAIVAFNVRRREREVGIKVVLGAGPGRVRADVFRSGIVPTAAGIAVGAVAIVPVGAAVRSQLFGVGALDPLAVIAAVAVLLGTAAFAAYWPARRATRVEPASILRIE